MLDIFALPPKPTVLVIDDNVDTLILQRKTLALEGYEVFTAESGTEALDLLAKNKHLSHLSLILLDMNLGDMSGTEFLDILRDSNPQIYNTVPIVFFSSADEVPVSKAIGFIRKPVDLDKFVKDIQCFIERGMHAS